MAKPGLIIRLVIMLFRLMSLVMVCFIPLLMIETICFTLRLVPYVPRLFPKTIMMVFLKGVMSDMENRIYSVYDVASRMFGAIFMARTDESAKNNFEYSLSRPEVPDYVRRDAVLYAICTFDTDSGVVMPLNPPELIDRGEFIKIGVDENA